MRRAYNPSTLLYQDLMYVLYDRGLFGCFDPKTGEEVYDRKRIPRAKHLLRPPGPRDKIFCVNEDGVTFVIRTGKEFEILHTNTLAEDDMCMATPAIVGDRLLMRTARGCIASAREPPRRRGRSQRSRLTVTRRRLPVWQCAKMPPPPHDARSLESSPAPAVMTPSGPLLVLAGAGTGKTRVVTYRIAKLIRRGTGQRILAVTFTNKAAREMQERAASCWESGCRRSRRFPRFTRCACGSLRRHATKLGYPANFAIYDRGDQESVARAACAKSRARPDLAPGDLINFVSRWKTNRFDPTRRRHTPAATANIWPRWATAVTRALKLAARSTSTTCCCLPKSCLRALPNRARPRCAAFRTCSSTSTRTPTARSTGS